MLLPVFMTYAMWQATMCKPQSRSNISEKNILRYTVRPQGAATRLYDGLRTEIARILLEIRRLERAEPEDRSSLWLDQERAQIEADAVMTSRRIDGFIRNGDLKPESATSFLNDSAYA